MFNMQRSQFSSMHENMVYNNLLTSTNPRYFKLDYKALIGLNKAAFQVIKDNPTSLPGIMQLNTITNRIVHNPLIITDDHIITQFNM